MPNLPPSIASGQSIAPVQYNKMVPPNSIPGTSPFTGPESIIERRLGSIRAMPQHIFPTDLPKYHFTIIENEWHYTKNPNNLGRLTAERMFKLPLPRELVDKNEVNYDTNFNYLSAVAQLFGSTSTAAGAAVGDMVGSALGMKINNFKSVTLQVPDFKTHQLSWTLAPKTFIESQNLQKMLFALKKGMSPRKGGAIGIGGNLVLGFPKIYTLYFSPNPQWLFKFKPCVLSTLVVDYAGGNPIPAFFTSIEDPNQNPPESITVAMNLIELEYWLDSKGADTDFKIDENGLPTNDPLDGMSWYHYNQPQDTTGPTIPLEDQIGGPVQFGPNGGGPTFSG